jgi:transposase
MRRLSAIPAPGVALKVLVNPRADEIERYTGNRGYPHTLRIVEKVGWTVHDVCACVAYDMDAYRLCPDRMWHALVVVEHQHGEKKCQVSIYGARFVG